jgi:hypothetical protein
MMRKSLRMLAAVCMMGCFVQVHAGTAPFPDVTLGAWMSGITMLGMRASMDRDPYYYTLRADAIIFINDEEAGLEPPETNQKLEGWSILFGRLYDAQHLRAYAGGGTGLLVRKVDVYHATEREGVGAPYGTKLVDEASYGITFPIEAGVEWVPWKFVGVGAGLAWHLNTVDSFGGAYVYLLGCNF